MIGTRIFSEAARYVNVAAILARAVDGVIRHVDLQAILDRLDLTSIVLNRLDLERVVREVVNRLTVEDLRTILDQVDVDDVTRRVDVEAVLDRLDLTAVVLDRVDLQAVINATLAHLDLVAISEHVIDGVDLPEIIRESTGSMASDTVENIRLRGLGADHAVSRAVDRLLLRRERTDDEPSP